MMNMTFKTCTYISASTIASDLEASFVSIASIRTSLLEVMFSCISANIFVLEATDDNPLPVGAEGNKDDINANGDGDDDADNDNGRCCCCCCCCKHKDLTKPLPVRKKLANIKHLRANNISVSEWCQQVTQFVNIQCLCSAFSIVGIAIEDLSMIDPDMMINKISRERKKMTQTQSREQFLKV